MNLSPIKCYPLQPEPCPSIFLYHILLKRNGNFEDEKFVRSDVCNNLMCSTEFQIDSVQYELEDIFSVNLKSGDIFGNYNGNLNFSDTFSKYIITMY